MAGPYSSDAERNREAWTKVNAEWTDGRAVGGWARDEITWGIWKVPEASLGTLGDVAGLDVVELGCGTAYVSAWLAKRGSRPVGVDVTPAQLATAQRCQDETGIEFPLLEASAEDVPLPDASFDLAVSEYGASIWCDPYRWIPEAARILRPGGRLVFVAGAAIQMLCYPTDDDSAPAEATLHRDYFGMHRFEWHNEEGIVDSIEFHLGHGDMIRLLRSCGFEIEDLLEIQPPAGAVSEIEADTPIAWARRWPSVEAWKVRKARPG
jgi:ubiquinone/menaquinone biosynthesis C-methylase UbiE